MNIMLHFCSNKEDEYQEIWGYGNINHYTLHLMGSQSLHHLAIHPLQLQPRLASGLTWHQFLWDLVAMGAVSGCQKGFPMLLVSIWRCSRHDRWCWWRAWALRSHHWNPLPVQRLMLWQSILPSLCTNFGHRVFGDMWRFNQGEAKIFHIFRWCTDCSALSLN